MPVNWEPYVQARRRYRREPLGDQERLAIEAMVAGLLHLSAEQQAGPWGEAIGYGFFAAVVLRIPSHVHHALHGARGDLAVKVFRSDAPTLFVDIQRTLFRQVQGRLPGVQRTRDAGIGCDGQGRVRGYLVLDYIDGQPLDHYLLDNRSLSPVQVRHILDSFFKDVLIPVWAEGYRFWDFRGANLIIDPDSGRLTMIDTDALHISLREAVAQPPTWTRRDAHERLAVQNLPHVITRVLVSQGKWGEVGRKRVRALVHQALQTGMLPAALHALGRDAARRPVDRAVAVAAVDGLLAALADQGLLAVLPTLLRRDA